VFRGLRAYAEALTGCNALFVSLLEPEGQQRTCVYAWADGAEVDVSLLRPLPMNGGPHARAVATGEAVVVEALQVEMAAVDNVALGYERDPRAPNISVALPLAVLGRIIGGFEVQIIDHPNPWSLVGGLQLAANVAAVSVDNLRLRSAEREAQRLEALSRAFELASQHKSDFLASMSHELRTPLNAIIGFSEVLLDHSTEAIPEDQRTTFLTHIHQSGQHLLGLINDILDLSKIEAGHMELFCERVALAELVEDCVSTMRVVATRKRISLTTACEPPEMVISIDPARFKQILYNLLDNAVKFTPEGGHVKVDVQANQSRTVLTVCDDGVGIDPEDQVMIFDEFRQVHSTGQHQQGTGLGLALVRKLVELHGGTIHLESIPGEGSCFTIILMSS
jgi:signal transduction histidine kinase